MGPFSMVMVSGIMPNVTVFYIENTFTFTTSLGRDIGSNKSVHVKSNLNPKP